MSRIYTRTLRLHLDKEEERSAWEYLQNPDANQFRSANQAIVTAINFYCEHRKDGGRSDREDSETDVKLLREIRKIIREELAEAARPVNTAPSSAPGIKDSEGSSSSGAFSKFDPDDLDAALDFIDGF